MEQGAAAVAQALDRHLGGGWAPESMALYSVGDEAWWLVTGSVDDEPFRRLVSTDGTVVRERLSRTGAEQAARGWLRAQDVTLSAGLLEQRPDNLEYRGATMPVWRVDVQGDESLSLYLHPWTGELLARRTDRWRLFDFFWMLHIMDYDSRDHIDNPLLQSAAFIGIVVSLSGLLYWAVSTRLFRRRREPARG